MEDFGNDGVFVFANDEDNRWSRIFCAFIFLHQEYAQFVRTQQKHLPVGNIFPAKLISHSDTRQMRRYSLPQSRITFNAVLFSPVCPRKNFSRRRLFGPWLSLMRGSRLDLDILRVKEAFGFRMFNYETAMYGRKICMQTGTARVWVTWSYDERYSAKKKRRGRCDVRKSYYRN